MNPTPFSPSTEQDVRVSTWLGAGVGQEGYRDAEDAADDAREADSAHDSARRPAVEALPAESGERRPPRTDASESRSGVFMVSESRALSINIWEPNPQQQIYTTSVATFGVIVKSTKHSIPSAV